MVAGLELAEQHAAGAVPEAAHARALLEVEDGLRGVREERAQELGREKRQLETVVERAFQARQSAPRSARAKPMSLKV